MAKTFVQPGKIVTLTAPGGGVVSGTGYLIGTLFVVALDTVAATLPFPAAVTGVFTLPKTSAQAWTEGQRIYWDNGNHRCDSTSTVGEYIGTAVAVAASPSATGTVRLNGAAAAFSQGNQGAVADLVDNSGGAAADGTIGAVTNPDLSAWNGGTDPTAAQATAIGAAVTALKDAVKELSTKQNAILDALRAAGLIS